ncbi:MAG TPA: hypothetical protein VF461_15975 [Gemmatimonadaceae bacterium]
MMRVQDGTVSPCGARSRRQIGWRLQAQLAAMLLTAGLGALPRTAAAQEYYNLDAGRPTRLEDATPTERQELELQMPALRLDQVENGPRVWRADSKISYGIAAFTEVELRLPMVLVDPPSADEPRTIGMGGLAVGATHALTLETAAMPALAVTGEWVAPVGGLSAHVGTYSAKLLLTKTFSHWRVSMNGGIGTWAIRPASPRATSTSCPPVPSGGIPWPGCSNPPPPIPPVVGCARAPSNQASFACIAGAPILLGEASRTRSMADTTALAALSGQRYTAAFGIDHAFPLSSTLLIADVVYERYMDLYTEADVIGELGFRHQLTPQLVADIGVSRSFAGQVRSSSVTLGMSFNLPLQLRGAR